MGPQKAGPTEQQRERSSAGIGKQEVRSVQLYSFGCAFCDL